MRRLVSSISSRTTLSASIPSFSAFHCAVIVSALPFSSASSFCSAARRSCEAASTSFFRASRSISSCVTRRVTSSSSAGIEVISVRMPAAASSTRSIALSGRNRSEM